MEIEDEDDVIRMCDDCYNEQPLDYQIAINAYTIGYRMAHRDPEFNSDSVDYYSERVKKLLDKIQEYKKEAEESKKLG